MNIADLTKTYVIEGKRVNAFMGGRGTKKREA
jgi:hypothetical protein